MKSLSGRRIPPSQSPVAWLVVAAVLSFSRAEISRGEEQFGNSHIFGNGGMGNHGWSYDYSDRPVLIANQRTAAARRRVGTRHRGRHASNIQVDRHCDARRSGN
jgi:hypothetical protein